MENSSLPAYAEKKCCLTRAERQQTLVSLKGVFDFETKIDYCEMISWELDMISQERTVSLYIPEMGLIAVPEKQI